MENNTQLPVEVVNEIKEKAKLSADFLSNDEHVVADHIRGYEQGWEQGATAYAIKLHHAISILEQNYKSYHESKKCFTTEEIEASWKRYKANNNL